MRIATICFFLLIGSFVFSQKYIGITEYATPLDPSHTGAILEVDNNNLTTIFDFYDNGSKVNETVTIGSKIYGFTQENGADGAGTLFEYDTITSTFIIKQHLEDASGSNNTIMRKLEVHNGLIYGIQSSLFGGYKISNYDPVTNQFSEVVNLSGTGINDIGDFVITNGKIYAINLQTPTGNNVLFSFDLTSNTLNIEHNFANATGNWCHSLLLHSNGKIYGAPISGGTNSKGVIFEFDPSSHSYSILYHLTSQNQADNLTEGPANNLYGYINPSFNNTRIYSFDLSTNSFNNLFFLPSNRQLSGNAAYFRDYNPLQYVNGKLITISRSTSNSNVLIDYEINSQQFRSRFSDVENFSIINSNELTFGNYNKLYKYDSTSGSLQSLNNVKLSTSGKIPVDIIKQNDIIFGLCTSGGILQSNYGRSLYKYDIVNNNFEVLIDFYDQPLSLPEALISGNHDELFIKLGRDELGFGNGVILKYDLINNNYSELVIPSNNNLVDNILNSEMYYLYNKLYFTGWTGGVKNLYKYENNNIVLALQNVGGYIIDDENVIYGITENGGNNNQGYLYSFNIQTEMFQVLQHSSTTIEVDNGDFSIKDSNNILVLENTNGNSPEGRVLNIDKQQNTISEIYRFDNAVKSTGFDPTKILSINDEHFIISEQTASLSSSSRSLLLKFDTFFLNSQIILDVQQNGTPPLSSTLLYEMYDGTLAFSSFDTHFDFQQQDNTAQTVFNFGNVYSFFSELIDVSPDNVIPSTPMNLQISNATSYTLDLDWDQSVDNTDIDYYLITDNFGNSYTSSDNFIVLPGLNPFTTYCFTINAIDINGNSSNASNQSCETTLASSSLSNELFFTEYIEGSSNNKALEIGNYTGNTIDLSNYSIKLASNGNNFGNEMLFPNGDSISNNDSYVIIHNSMTTSCRGNADLIMSNMTAFNGNDAIGLFKNGVLIDIIGTEGDNTTYAQNTTLIRKSTIVNPSITFNSNEWNIAPQDDCSNLGIHTITLSTDSFSNDYKVFIYPNPTNGILKIDSKNQFLSFKLYNLSGQLIKSDDISKNQLQSIDINSIPKGVYLIQLFGENGEINTLKIIKE